MRQLTGAKFDYPSFEELLNSTGSCDNFVINLVALSPYIKKNTNVTQAFHPSHQS